MSTIEEKRAAFHQYLSSSGVISALSKALIKLYEEPNKPDDPVNFVRRHMGSEDYFILGDERVAGEKNEEEELVLSSLIEKKSEEMAVGTVILETENVPEENNPEIIEEDGTQIVDGNVEGLEAIDGENIELNVNVVDLLAEGFEKLKSDEFCNSILKLHLTDEIFEKLKNDGDASFYECIKSGLENADSVLGIYAIDLQFYDKFSEIFDPVIESYHGFGKEGGQPNCDWGDLSAFEAFDENEFVVSIRISCMRNIQDYPVVCKMAESELKDSLNKVKTVIECFNESSKGTIYVLDDLSQDQEEDLKSIGAFMDTSNQHLSSANVYQQWPLGRGVFVTADKSLIIQINGEDHLKFTSIEGGNDFGKAYQRLVGTVNQCELPFARHDRLGWLTFSPANVGTALNIAVDMKLVKLHSNPDQLHEILKNFSTIHVKPLENEIEGLYTLYNQSTVGTSECGLVQQFYDAIRGIIECESNKE